MPVKKVKSASRFADSKLQRFYQEFHAHREEFEVYRAEQAKERNELLSVIKDNTAAVASMSRQTESIIEVWTASQGALKVLRWIGAAIRWLSGVGVAVGAVWLMLKSGMHK